MTHTSLFAGQVTSVAKELAERKKRTSVVFNKRAAASSTPVGRHDHPQSSRARAQPARPVTHLSPCQSLQLPWRQPSAGVTKHLEAQQRGLEQDQKKLMTGRGGGLPLSRTSFCSRPSAPPPFSSCGRPPFPFSGLLEVHKKGPVCLASSPTRTSSQFRVSAAIDHQPGALPSA